MDGRGVRRASSSTSRPPGRPSAASCGTGSRSSACSWWSRSCCWPPSRRSCRPGRRTGSTSITGARQGTRALAHVLGTDVAGRDIWARLLYGGRTSIIVGFGAVGLYLIIGTLLGMLAGFYGGAARPGDHALHGHDPGHPAAAPDHRVRVRRGAQHRLGDRGHRAARLAGDLPARARPAPGAARVGVHHRRPRGRRAGPRDPAPAHAPQHPRADHRGGDVRRGDGGAARVEPELPGPRASAHPRRAGATSSPRRSARSCSTSCGGSGCRRRWLSRRPSLA